MDLLSLKNKALRALTVVRSSKRRPAVGVIGDMAVDRFVFGNVDRISPEAPVPILLVERSEDKAGCAANVVNNLAHLATGAAFETHLYGYIGRDEGSTTIQKLLKESCVGVKTHLKKNAEWVTPIKSRYIAGSQHQLLRVDHEKSSEKKVYAKELPPDWLPQLAKSSLILCQDYSKGMLSEKLLQDLVAFTREKKLPLFIDPNRNTPPAWYKGATLLTPNIDEAERLCGFNLMRGQNEKLVVEAAKRITDEFKLDGILITRGKHGMTGVFRGEKSFSIPSFAREVYDVTGAGDTVIATLGLFAAFGLDIELAAYIANAAASVVVSKVGTAVASMDEIRGVLENLR